MAETVLTTAHGEFTLLRPHTPASSPLRAWSAADELLLSELQGQQLGRVLIVNDEFGALACGLAAATPTIWTDSALSRDAIESNLAANSLAPAGDRLVPGDQIPQGLFDTVVVRVPKTIALLEFQLAVAAAVGAENARVVGTGMTRHIHRSTVTAFETAFGPTTTSRAVRKARLVHSRVPGASDAPVQAVEARSFTSSSGLIVAELPGTFSEGRVDAGSALLIDHLDVLTRPGPGSTVIDLGCGTGVLAASAAQAWPEASYLLTDVSDLSLAAARLTWVANNLVARASFESSDGLRSIHDESADIVLCNPPFHQGHAIDAGLTDRLLEDAARALRPSGEALVVGQREQNLHTRMLRWFNEANVVSKHPSFVVIHGHL